MKIKRIVLALLFSAAAFSSSLMADEKILRVGISPTDPPMEYKENHEPVGLEIDFAKELGNELGMKIEFVEVKFGKLIPNLLDNKIDVIMAGMSITSLRRMQIAFSDSYMKIGQMPLVRIEERNEFLSPMDVVMTSKTVGTKEATTGQFLLLQEFPNAQKRFLADPAAGMNALKKKKIDIFIMDSPYILWLAMKNEGKLVPLPFLLSEENLAWGVRKGDTELLAKLNEILAKWKETGHLDQMINKWIPGRS